MQLAITVEGQDGKSVDIFVNSEQKIEDTLTVLEDVGMIQRENSIDVVWSRRIGKAVPANCTYKEAGIYYGDILTVGKRE